MLRNYLPGVLSSAPTTNVVSAPYSDTAAAVTGVNVDLSTTDKRGKARIQTSHLKPQPATCTPKASQVQKDVPTMQPKSEPGHGTSNHHAAGQQKGAQNFSKEDIVELL